jgi:hypothetical protein
MNQEATEIMQLVNSDWFCSALDILLMLSKNDKVI